MNLVLQALSIRRSKILVCGALDLSHFTQVSKYAVINL